MINFGVTAKPIGGPQCVFVDAARTRTIYFEGGTQPTDALKAAWVPLADLAHLNMRAIHAQTLTHMLHI